jgi:hypothetical protein
MDSKKIKSMGDKMNDWKKREIKKCDDMINRSDVKNIEKNGFEIYRLSLTKRSRKL